MWERYLYNYFLSFYKTFGYQIFYDVFIEYFKEKGEKKRNDWPPSSSSVRSTAWADVRAVIDEQKKMTLSFINTWNTEQGFK